MSSSTDSADNTSTCVEDKEGDDSTEDVVAKQLALQIDHLSIENEGGVVMSSTDNAENTDNITITILCAACGKEGEEDNMNICNKCKMVHYCNAACKKKHKSKHKKKCERRVAELYDKKLFKEPPLPEDCPICMLPLPSTHEEGEVQYQSCCGKVICSFCIDAMDEREGEKLCVFCRTPRARSDRECIERNKLLMEKDHADEFYQLASYYAQGIRGMPQDWAKANELLLKAGELGCAHAHYILGSSFSNGMGLEFILNMIDKKELPLHRCGILSGHDHKRYFIGTFQSIAARID